MSHDIIEARLNNSNSLRIVKSHETADDYVLERNGGGSGGGDDMHQRIKDLEKDAQQMKTDIAVMRSNYATRSDVSDAKTSIIIWVVGAVFLSQIIPAIPNILKVFFPAQTGH